MKQHAIADDTHGHKSALQSLRDSKKQTCLRGSDAGCAQLLDVLVVPPRRGDCLPLRVEVEACLSIEVEVATDGLLVPCEGEHWQGNWDWHIHSHLTTFDLIHKLSGSCTAAREDGSAVAILVFVDELDGVIV